MWLTGMWSIPWSMGSQGTAGAGRALEAAPRAERPDARPEMLLGDFSSNNSRKKRGLSELAKLNTIHPVEFEFQLKIIFR